MKPRNPLLQKKALDETMVMWNDPSYAEHQHHSDPGYSTQNGKDYAGRGSTEVEGGALKDGIPANLLSVELGKEAAGSMDPIDLLRRAADTLQGYCAEVNGDMNDSLAMEIEEYLAQLPQPKQANVPKSVLTGSKSELGKFSASAAPAIANQDITRTQTFKAIKSAIGNTGEFNPENAGITGSTEPDPESATFFKESEPNSPFSTEEEISNIINGQGFQYGARVDDGTTLWLRGRDERISFNPKDGMVTYSKNGKAEMACPVDQLAVNIGRMVKSAARAFQAAIRPSPTKVFQDKVDNATGKQPVVPDDPNDDEVAKAQMTLENAGVGDQIGVNAAGMPPNKTLDPTGDTPTHTDDYKNCAECGEQFQVDPRCGGDYCSACRRKMREGSKTAVVTKTYGTGTPPGGTPNDPSIDDEEDEDKTAGAKTAEIGIHETPKFLPPRNDIRRHLDEQVQDEVMEGVMDEDKTADAVEGEVVRREGNFMLYAFPPDTPLGQYGEIKRPAPKHEIWYVGNKAKALPIAQENWGPLTHEQENQLLERGSLNLPDIKLRLTCVDYSKPTILPKKKLQASDADDAANEYYLDTVRDMKDEAKQVFMEDMEMQQVAVENGMTMEDLWLDVGEDFTQNYYESAYAKQASIEVEEEFKCPNCKSTKGKAVKDGVDDAQSLRECLTCRSFYQL